MALTGAMAQSSIDDDIWKEFNIGEVDYKQARNYCQRMYAFYRVIDDGKRTFKNREDKLYRVLEGIIEIDIRYSKEYDDGATFIVGRDLVHPDKKGKFVEFFELKPYTFLEKARKVPKHYRIETSGDTTRVYAKHGLAGTVIKDTMRHELAMHYDALAPDTSLTLNLLIARAHMSNVKVDAHYWYDEASEDYVPQGNLKRAVFDGKIDYKVMGLNETYDERTELYIDSVAYLTRDQYRADKKLTKEERLKRAGYTDADIDRLKQKHGVPQLTDAIRQRIEDQRDWDEEYELWKATQGGGSTNDFEGLD